MKLAGDQIFVVQEISLKNHCSLSEKAATRGVLHKFHRKTPALESFLNKVAGLTTFNFIKKKFQRGCFPVNFLEILRKPTFKNIHERLPLYLHVILFTIHGKDTANNL